MDGGSILRGREIIFYEGKGACFSPAIKEKDKIKWITSHRIWSISFIISPLPRNYIIFITNL